MAKMKKSSTRIDMTAMCDVSFLLLTFFVLTSTAKTPEVHPVDLPNSTKETKIPTDDIVTISVDEEKVYFGIAGREDKKDILQRMGNEYKIEFTPQETEKFAGMENFGVDIRELKQLLAKPASELMKVDNHQTGIPYKDSLNNQLASWVRNARESSWQRKESFLKVAIKGDANEQFGTVKKIIDIMQEQRQNRFYLVTGLRDANF
ncbi:biopolymer transporter ExbD [Myroides ceti]|jgi:biopolymer transport protein ExbD|uniref:Biopolymer transporter ExbD n=2 Tax=Paenimyroides ceti TaxID=395087 RepID=A0ABT8CQP8_9FLAO|nr:biopolymer transporter ExbD [Paenimyroides ceti]MDN3706321.1 biopolymer transporter ExbD [Paenimyroides ceti]